jgi:hypothetical protein
MAEYSTVSQPPNEFSTSSSTPFREPREKWASATLNEPQFSNDQRERYRDRPSQFPRKAGSSSQNWRSDAKATPPAEEQISLGPEWLNKKSSKENLSTTSNTASTSAPFYPTRDNANFSTPNSNPYNDNSLNWNSSNWNPREIKPLPPPLPSHISKFKYTKQDMLDLHQQTSIPEDFNSFPTIVSIEGFVPVAKLPPEEQDEASILYPAILFLIYQFLIFHLILQNRLIGNLNTNLSLTDFLVGEI